MSMTAELQSLLRKDEELFGDFEELNGDSFFTRVRNADGATDRTALLVMPNRGDFIEPVRIDGEINLNVRALKGLGYVAFLRPEARIIDRYLLDPELEDGQEREGHARTLGPGYVYGYYAENGLFVVRDDCSKPFLKEHESPAKGTRVEKHIRGAATRLKLQ